MCYKCNLGVYNYLIYLNQTGREKEEEKKNMKTNTEKINRFKEAGGKISKSEPTNDEKKLHYATILGNPEKYIWHASREKKLFIRQANGPSGEIGVIADKHLINVMRYLILNWDKIQEVVNVEISKFNQKFPYRYFAREVYRNAPSFFEATLACWPTLVNEVVERFGPDALTSLLDGN